jgi:hypothetical protein
VASGNGDFINDHLFLVDTSRPALPSPLAGRMDGETTELPEQLAVQIDDHPRVDRPPLVVRERGVEPAGGKKHQTILPGPRVTNNDKPEEVATDAIAELEGAE